MEYWKVGDSVEAHSYPHQVPGGIRISKEEFDEFIAALPVPVIEPVRDLAAEIDDLKIRITKLER